jgi:spore coat protein U-like protein
MALGTATLGINSYGAVQSDSFFVTTKVSQACTVIASGMAFGTYDANSPVAETQTSTITATCTANLAATITLSEGTLGDGTSTPGIPVRGMTPASGQGGDALKYNLYKDSAWLNLWGDAQDVGNTFTPTPGAPITLTVYGSIPINQSSVVAGDFTDTIVATVTY